MRYALLLLLLTGCGASNLSAVKPGDGFTPTTPPAIGASVQQAGGVNTQATGINYNSALGAGATLLIGSTLVLNLWLSHSREMKRIAMNGKN